jgi:hypothetical protein
MIAHPTAAQLVIAVVLAALAVLVWLAALWARDARRTVAAEREWGDLLAAEKPADPLDGATFEMTAIDAYGAPLHPRQAATAPQPAYVSPPPPVPASSVSGPLPVLDTALDAEAFIASMQARTDYFVALMAEPAAAPA